MALLRGPNESESCGHMPDPIVILMSYMDHKPLKGHVVLKVPSSIRMAWLMCQLAPAWAGTSAAPVLQVARLLSLVGKLEPEPYTGIGIGNLEAISA